MKSIFPFIVFSLIWIWSFFWIPKNSKNKIQQNIIKQDTIKKEHYYIETQGKLTKADAG